MRHTNRLFVCPIAIIVVLSSCAAWAQGSTESVRTEHPEAQWFGEAGLGLFIHWGISSVQAKNELSWAMMAEVPWFPNAIAPNEYFAHADRFNPERYDPYKWIETARDAGFKYAVLTSRHHDGFSMWPSKMGEFGARTHMNGRDLIGPFVEACHHYGLKAGLYYSPGDWYRDRHHMSFRWESDGSEKTPHLGLNHEPTTLGTPPSNWGEKTKEYVGGQVEELLTSFGVIDLLWFDGRVPGAITVDRIRELQPGIVVNDRQFGVGDFSTKYESRLPSKNPNEDWWECCMCSGRTWGYTKPETCAPASKILSQLVQVRRWGGNFLLNFGPRSTGEMPDLYYERLSEIEDWMAHSGEAVFGVGPEPEGVVCNTPVTTRENTWYLHALPGSREPLVSSCEKAPEHVRLLRTGQALPFQHIDGRLRVTIPGENRTELVDVVQVTWDGESR